MRESFVFYKSFMDAVETIPQIKHRYFLLESIIKLGLFSEESSEKVTSFCMEIEQKLSKNSHVFGLFLSIKPQLIANYKKYLNGLKGKQYGTLGGEYGSKGGRPKKPPKNPPNENVNENENENENVNVSGGIKKIDKFSSPIFGEFLDAYKKVFGNDGYLSNKQRDKVIELYETIPDIKEKLPEVMQRLKDLSFANIDFKPNLAWLLKNDNFYSVASGEYEKDDFASMLAEIKQERPYNPYL